MDLIKKFGSTSGKIFPLRNTGTMIRFPPSTHYTALNAGVRRKQGLTFFPREELGIVLCPHDDGLLEEDGEGIDAHQGEVQHDPLSHEGVLGLALLHNPQVCFCQDSTVS